MGPSGSGKSSLLYLLSGLKRPSTGEIQLEELKYRNLDEHGLVSLRRTRFGFVFQQPFLLNYLTALENVLTAAASKDREATRHAAGLLERLGMGDLRHRFPHQLSGGEKQRVCVARAMINRPQVIFADEPTAALDHANGHQVMDLLASYRDRGLVIAVTHDPEMIRGADLVLEMRDGDVIESREPSPTD
jgi:putative ABC transport system ATP-binding protein